MEILIGLLAAATLLSGVARRLRIPYPIVLVIGGAVLAAIPGVPDVRVPPNLVFLVFLPPLLYSGSLFQSPAELRHNATGILLLAVGLVLVTVAGVAVVAHVLVGLPWPEAFVLGAILGATDPIAATAIIHRLGAPERISTLLEGEALVNDGTSLTVFKVALGAVGAHSFSIGHGVVEFVAVSLGGTAIGAAVGALSAWVRSQIDDPDLEIAIGILTAYTAYIAADQAGVSGVLGAVAAGVVTAHYSTKLFSPGSRLRSHAFWQTISFVLNALLFLLIGLQLRAALSGIQSTGVGSLVAYSVCVILVLILLRMIWMYAVPTLVPAVRRHLPGGQIRSGWHEQLVLGWSGMRGALSLAAALSLPLAGGPGGLGDRGLIVFLAFVSIFVTLVLPGLTLVPLIRALGLGQSEQVLRAGAETRLQVVRAGLSELDRVSEEGDLPQATLARVRDYYEARLDSLERRLDHDESERGDAASHVGAERELRSRLIEAQRRALRRLAGERAAPPEVIREIERDLDLDSTRLPRS